MEYVEATFSAKDDDAYDIITAALADIGFESFAEERGKLKAYIQQDQYHEETMKESLELYRDSFSYTYTTRVIPHENWNAVWESSFQPVVVAGQVYIRAAFHAPDQNYPIELLIQPKMSFGTGHHPTTALVVEAMLECPFEGKKVFDFGTGTGILAILARKLGASEIWASDNDAQCIENATENFEMNGCNSFIHMLKGEATAFPGITFDVVIANITRNIIVQYLPDIAGSLAEKGMLITSGYFVSDLEGLKAEALKYGLSLLRYKEKEKWCAATFQKI